jgi:hypothetical protein
MVSFCRFFCRQKSQGGVVMLVDTRDFVISAVPKRASRTAVNNFFDFIEPRDEYIDFRKVEPQALDLLDVDDDVEIPVFVWSLEEVQMEAAERSGSRWCADSLRGLARDHEFEPLTFEQGLMFAAKYPDVQRERPLVIMGSHGVFQGNLVVPVLTANPEKGRGLIHLPETFLWNTMHGILVRLCF